VHEGQRRRGLRVQESQGREDNINAKGASNLVIQKGCTNPQVQPGEDLPEPRPTNKKKAQPTKKQEEKRSPKKNK